MGQNNQVTTTTSTQQQQQASGGKLVFGIASSNKQQQQKAILPENAVLVKKFVPQLKDELIVLESLYTLFYASSLNFEYMKLPATSKSMQENGSSCQFSLTNCFAHQLFHMPLDVDVDMSYEADNFDHVKYVAVSSKFALETLDECFSRMPQSPALVKYVKILKARSSTMHIDNNIIACKLYIVPEYWVSVKKYILVLEMDIAPLKLELNNEMVAQVTKFKIEMFNNNTKIIFYGDLTFLGCTIPISSTVSLNEHLDTIDVEYSPIYKHYDPNQGISFSNAHRMSLIEKLVPNLLAKADELDEKICKLRKLRLSMNLKNVQTLIFQMQLPKAYYIKGVTFDIHNIIFHQDVSACFFGQVDSPTIKYGFVKYQNGSSELKYDIYESMVCLPKITRHHMTHGIMPSIGAEFLDRVPYLFTGCNFAFSQFSTKFTYGVLNRWECSVPFVQLDTIGSQAVPLPYIDMYLTLDIKIVYQSTLQDLDYRFWVPRLNILHSKGVTSCDLSRNEFKFHGNLFCEFETFLKFMDKLHMRLDVKHKGDAIAKHAMDKTFQMNEFSIDIIQHKIFIGGTSHGERQVQIFICTDTGNTELKIAGNNVPVFLNLRAEHSIRKMQLAQKNCIFTDIIIN